MLKKNKHTVKNLQFSVVLRAMLLSSVFAFLVSCSEDDEPTPMAPVISNFEFGEGSQHGTGQVAYKGSDIHMEAEIMAEATVSSITVSIHGHDLTVAEGEEEWDFEQIFDDVAYQVINPTFHEHVDIPANIPAGEYHITLKVTDEAGNSTETEGELEIMDVIAYSDVSVDETVARGSDMHAEFMINAVHGVHHVIVDIHVDGITVGEGEEEWHYENEFEEGYHGETEVEFHEHIDIPANAPAGEYHIIFTIEDEEGNTKEFESHIEVTAS
ncbi:hypothetical protein OKW21_006102 [Catalinimonas alkaloidigena]|uniref:DUF4625 domain-containing protein n=1 Tax=Catalinimonas alkaloidigena TaxID=1075417 RepID=UPI002406B152|nr:DUF4625 domain-containing protein [Catalinimonas alkaloidigena]MDF9800839.1 hypothetical protein [Catalinimonas alkaloidigena]